MSLCFLELKNFRSFQHVTINPSPRFNVIYGLNGSGKTTLLEAIYLLSLGRSFRSNSLSNVIKHGENSFQLFSRVEQNGGLVSPLGLEFTASKLSVRFSEERVNRRSDLANYLPSLLITPESKFLLSKGPSYRREFIDWGVFHVEPRFLSVWQRYSRSLKQRNAMLKRREFSELEDDVWVCELVEGATIINGMRNHYLSEMFPLLLCFLHKLLDSDPICMEYFPGWSDGEQNSYQESLVRNRARDIALGYTKDGVHRAELKFKIKGRLIQEFLSSGQLRLVVYSLYLAQLAYYQKHTSIRCTVLIDEFASELDTHHRDRLLSLLADLSAQVYITSTDRNDFSLDNVVEKKTFHVERGCVSEVL
ncbi:MAG: DNA replication/repair protein RecF [Gammaproteobacteria bacterium]|nr:DNA replication/repair protein RecF [Gammaproteobacteria bacterium]